MEFVRKLCRLLARMVLGITALAMIGLILGFCLLLLSCFTNISLYIGHLVRCAPIGAITAILFMTGCIAGGALLIYHIVKLTVIPIWHYGPGSIPPIQYICTFAWFCGPATISNHSGKLLDAQENLAGLGYILVLCCIPLIFRWSGWLLKKLTLPPAPPNPEQASTPSVTATQDDRGAVRAARLMIRIGLTLPAILCFFACLSYGRGVFPDFMDHFFAFYLQHGGDFAADVLAQKLPADDPQTLILGIFWPALVLAIFCAALAIMSLRTWQRLTKLSPHLFSLFLLAIPGWFILQLPIQYADIRLLYWQVIVLLMAGAIFALFIHLTLVKQLLFCVPSPQGPAAGNSNFAHPAGEATPAFTHSHAAPAAPGRWLRGLLRLILACGIVFSLGALLLFVLRWEVYYCERYQRPWHFFSDPVWRLPLLFLLCTTWFACCARGIWFSLTRPLTRRVLALPALAAAALSFLPVLYLLERPLALRLPADLLPRGWVWTEFLCIGLAVLIAVALWHLLIPCFCRLADWCGFADDGTARLSVALPLARRLREGLPLIFLTALAILLGGVAIHYQETILEFILRVYLHPKR